MKQGVLGKNRAQSPTLKQTKLTHASAVQSPTRGKAQEKANDLVANLLKRHQKTTFETLKDFKTNFYDHLSALFQSETKSNPHEIKQTYDFAWSMCRTDQPVIRIGCRRQNCKFRIYFDYESMDDQGHPTNIKLIPSGKGHFLLHNEVAHCNEFQERRHEDPRSRPIQINNYLNDWGKDKAKK